MQQYLQVSTNTTEIVGSMEVLCGCHNCESFIKLLNQLPDLRANNHAIKIKVELNARAETIYIQVGWVPI